MVRISDMEPLKELSRLLEHYRSLGMERLPRTGQIEQLLAFEPSKVHRDSRSQAGATGSGPEGVGGLDRASSQAMDPGQYRSLMELRQAVEQCRRCRLHETRTKVVFGQGPERARLMLVGEAPGRNEDLQGLPFVGRSGELLTKMLRAINIERREVFITSVVKCRPPKNRTPKSDEIAACLPWLKGQIGLIRPSIILCLGTTSAHALLDTDAPMAKLRGRFHPLPDGFWPDGISNPSAIKVAVTYHPAYLLRFGGAKQKALKLEAWHDLQMVEREYKNL